VKNRNKALLAFAIGLKANAIYHHKKAVIVDVRAEKVLILGSGGILGAVWQIGTLMRLEKEGKFDLNLFDLRIGTSAGALALMAVDGQLSLEDLDKIMLGEKVVRNDEELSLPHITLSKEYSKSSNPMFLLNALKYLQLPRFNNVLSSIIPEGTTDLTPLGQFVTKIHPDWSNKPTYVIASNLDTGQRVVFNNLSQISTGHAVMASCAAPGMFKPVEINNTRYIDGRVHSSINYDLAVKAKPKEILIITPSSGFTKITLRDKPLVMLSKVSRNFLEIHLYRIQLFCFIKRIKVNIIRPRPNEELILKNNSVFDVELVSNIYLETKK